MAGMAKIRAPVLIRNRQNTNALRLAGAARRQGRWIKATRHYARALLRRLAVEIEERRPGVVLAGEEGSGTSPEEIDAELAPELDPDLAGAVERPASGDRIDVLQIGWARRTYRWGELPLLRGIEAIRAKVSSSLPLAAMHIRLDGRPLRRVPAAPHAVAAERRPPPYTYLFNEWLDFRGLPPGLHRLQLFLEAEGPGFLSHQRLVCIDAREDDQEDGHSSGIVRLDAGPDGQIEERVNALPSVVYPARRTFLPSGLRRVLIIRVDQLGDFVASLPAIRRLRELLPQAEFVALLSPANRGLAENLSLFSAVITADFDYDPARKRRFMTLAKQRELRRRLHEFGFDLAIDLCPGEDSRPLLRLSGAPFTAGFGARQFPWLSLGIDIATRHRVSGKEQAPHALRVASFVEALGTMLRHEPIVLPLQTDFGVLAALGLERDRYAVLHTGARHATQRWPLSHYLALAHLLLQATALKLVLFVDGPEDAALVGRAQLPSPRCLVLVGRREYREFDAVISHCAVFIGNDSGPKHFAAMRGVKVVSVHGGRIAWGEWGQEGDGLIITRRIPCYGCGSEDEKECGKGLACLAYIRPAEVLAAVQKLLDAGPAPKAIAAAAASAPAALAGGRGSEC
jgi:ADP-heptose:LPS heptosyltransferase